MGELNRDGVLDPFLHVEYLDALITTEPDTKDCQKLTVFPYLKSTFGLSYASVFLLSFLPLEEISSASDYVCSRVLMH